jgi:hypothetical protein
VDGVDGSRGTEVREGGPRGAMPGVSRIPSLLNPMMILSQGLGPRDNKAYYASRRTGAKTSRVASQKPGAARERCLAGRDKRGVSWQGIFLHFVTASTAHQLDVGGTTLGALAVRAFSVRAVAGIAAVSCLGPDKAAPGS